MSRTEEIILHEKKADECQATADAARAEAEEHRWEAARLIVEEMDSGKSQRVLAKEIGKSQTHVGRMARVWKGFAESPETQRPDFNEKYQELAAKKKKPADAPKSSRGVTSDAESEDACPTPAGDFSRGLKMAKNVLGNLCDPQFGHKITEDEYKKIKKLLESSLNQLEKNGPHLEVPPVKIAGEPNKHESTYLKRVAHSTSMLDGTPAGNSAKRLWDITDQAFSNGEITSFQFCHWMDALAELCSTTATELRKNK